MTREKSVRLSRIGLVVLAVALLFALSGLQGDARLLAINALLYASFGLAWNIMGGFAGMFSFGHAAYFGIGAYTTAVLQVDYGLVPWLALPVAVVLAALVAMVTTYLALRYKVHGIFFALGTFAIAEMLRLLVTGSETLKRAGGYRVPLRDESWAWMQFKPDSPNYYFLILGIFLICMAATVVFASSRLGYLIVAARDDEQSVEATGSNPRGARLWASALSAGLTALTGVFYFEYFLTINPDLGFGQAVSVLILLPAIIGGVGTVLGPVVGGVVLATVGHYLAILVSSPPSWFTLLQGRAGVDQIVYGWTLILVILLLRYGIYGTLQRRRHASV